MTSVDLKGHVMISEICSLHSYSCKNVSCIKQKKEFRNYTNILEITNSNGHLEVTEVSRGQNLILRAL